MFKARGILNNDEYKTVNEIEFKDGVLSGDLGLVLMIQAHANLYQQQGYIPTYDYTPETNDYVKDALAVVLILRNICESLQFSGTLPELAYGEGNDY